MRWTLPPSPGRSRVRHKLKTQGGGAIALPPFSSLRCDMIVHTARIVGALAGNCDTVRMAFPQARIGNAHEGCFFAELFQRLRTHITHRSAQAPCKLVKNRGYRPFIGDLSLDTFRYELQFIAHFSLEITISRTARHGSDRAHAAICLERAALMQIDFAGAFLRTGQQ